MVGGIFFVKTDVQSGALAVAQEHEIQVVKAGEKQQLPAFSITLLYSAPDAQGRRKRRSGHEEAWSRARPRTFCSTPR
jgi:hypothetical protein